jgi:threonine/homoserine/homoserine lactone efflux protein
MTLSGLLVFAGIYFAAVASPGPGLALVVARGLAKGLQGLPWFVAGFVLGDLILMTLAVSGLAIIAKTFESAFLVLRYLGAAYLFFLAWKIWRAPVATLEVTADSLREKPIAAFLSSFLLTLGNPKPIIFFLSIMPLVVEMREITPLIYLELALTVIVVITPVMVAASILADRARRLLRSERALRNLNRGTAGIMAGAAAMVASR